MYNISAILRISLPKHKKMQENGQLKTPLLAKTEVDVPQKRHPNQSGRSLLNMSLFSSLMSPEGSEFTWQN